MEDRRSSEKGGKSFQVLKSYEIIRIRNSVLVYLLLVYILLCALPFSFSKNSVQSPFLGFSDNC